MDFAVYGIVFFFFFLSSVIATGFQSNFVRKKNKLFLFFKNHDFSNIFKFKPRVYSRITYKNLLNILYRHGMHTNTNLNHRKHYDFFKLKLL